MTGCETEWGARVGRPICVTMIPRGRTDSHTDEGTIIEAAGIEVVCRKTDGTLFSFRPEDIADVANWRGTILVKLK